jgi:hypothetical protein
VLAADLIIVVNYVVALLVPWVEADYPISNAWFPIFVPVKVSEAGYRGKGG